MITGIVNAALEPTITLFVLNSQGRQQSVDATVDTGFNGELTLPTAIATTLGLAFMYRHRGTLADGSSIYFDVYAATVLWDGAARAVEVEATINTTLVGTALLRDHGVYVEVRPSGLMTIDPLP